LDTVEYYNKNAAEYFESTVNIDMQDICEKYIGLLPEGGSILDLGCGSGRDSDYFISCGFDVTAMDASVQLCELAGIHIGQHVLNLSFSEIDFVEVFDGIWANASLLHVPGIKIDNIMQKIIRSMKSGGILYMSFKYGEQEGMQNGRYYTYYRSKTLKELIAKFSQLELIEIRKSQDIRAEMDTLWISAFVRKIDTEG
jgi:SAM-dependent methyltransferase